jgi:hypothetical protein
MHEISMPLDEPPGASPAVVSFGTHKGRSIEELLVEKPLYLWWLLSQAWAWFKYPELCRSICSLGPKLLAVTPKLKPSRKTDAPVSVALPAIELTKGDIEFLMEEIADKDCSAYPQAKCWLGYVIAKRFNLDPNKFPDRTQIKGVIHDLKQRNLITVKRCRARYSSHRNDRYPRNFYFPSRPMRQPE